MQFHLLQFSISIQKKSLLLFLLVLSVLPACKKSATSELDKLPAASQYGANTFGCLVNGKAFLPKTWGAFSGPKLSANYTPSPTGGLVIYAVHKSEEGSISMVSLITDSLEVSEGQTLKLSTRAPGNAAGFFDYISGFNYNTDQKSPGTLTITKLDLVNKIISGIFDFDVSNSNGETVKITNGRFDIHFPVTK